MVSLELICRSCAWRTIAGRADAIGRLRLVGLLRRDTEPDDALVTTLFVEAAPRMTCPACKEKSLFARPSTATEGNEDDWQSAVLCEICRNPIPPERLEAITNTKRCTACQGKAEAGQLLDDEPEYCPNCGAYVELRVSMRGGITRYRRFCTGSPACRL